MKKKGGYGMVFQNVTRNGNISAAGKGLYAYFAAFCGVSDECYPSVETITKEMGMTKDTFYKHINSLVAAGVVEKHQTVGNDGKFGRVMYRLTHNVTISEKSGLPDTENSDTDKSDTDFSERKNNINTNNNCKKEKNKYNVAFEQFWNVYPRKREKARAYKCYLARLKDGFSEDELFVAAKNYSLECKNQGTPEKYIKLAATFIGSNTPFLDWIKKEGVSNECECQSRRQASDFYEQFMGTGNCD